MAEERPNKRARSAAACNRCKHRKQRCDNGIPTCAACSSAGVACFYENRVYSAAYVEALELRAADLERQLRASQQQHGSSDQQQPSSHQYMESPATTIATAEATVNTRNHEADAAFDMLSTTSYLGTSSGFPLARTLRAVIGPPDVSSLRPSKRSLVIHTKPASPDSALGVHFVNTYLRKVHPKHAFISPRRIFDLHHSCQTLASSARPISEKSISARIEYFVLHLIYAIGARYMQLSQNEYHCNSDAYYAMAIEDVECLFETRTLESLEGMLLLVIFQLRSPSCPGIWSLVGTTMRHAISLGLHRKFHGPGVVDQRRKRIFWTTYMLERSIARTLGLPVSVSDRDIDVEFPANVPQDLEDEDDLSVAMLQNSAASPTSAVIHIFKLAQLESKIYSSIYRVDRPLTNDVSSKVAHFRQLLHDWKSQIPTAVPNTNNQEDAPPNSYVDRRYHVLHHHRVMLLLLLPSLTGMASSHADFQLCASSAGQVVQLYKQLHDHQNMLSYSLIALHATFVSGLTLIYCFLSSERAIFNPQFSSDVRACSTVLYVISERWPAARKVRDAFERMVSLTIEHDERQSTDSNSHDQMMGSHPPVEVCEQPPMDVLWSELAAQMPGPSLQPDSVMPGGVFPDPNDFWNCLGPWLGDDIDGSGQNWFDPGTEEYGSTVNVVRDHRWSLLGSEMNNP